MVPRWLLLVPFALITYFTWVKSIQQQRLVRPVSTLAQRDAHRAVHALKNRKNAWAAASVEQQELVPQQVHADTAQQQTHVDAPQQQQQEPQEQRRPTAVTSCPASRKPYHTLLTATAQVYQQWQCRVMYYHWKKQRALDPAGACTELTGFTRLVAFQDGNPDGARPRLHTPRRSSLCILFSPRPPYRASPQASRTRSLPTSSRSTLRATMPASTATESSTGPTRSCSFSIATTGRARCARGRAIFSPRQLFTAPAHRAATFF